ncbi:hypothetical protein ACFL50_05525 [Candidatus Latescibacterota bacterium]
MKFGFYKFGSESDSSSQSGSRRKGTVEIESDLSRLFLLAFMLLAAIFGWYLSKSSSEPSYVLTNSIEKTLQQTFRASLEGTISIRGNVLESYRSHQRYNPENGLSVISDEGSTAQAPVDPVSAMELILQSENIIENDMEDMYGHGTRHFSGALKLDSDNKSVGGIFHYWTDMKTLLAVRLEIAKVERDIITQDNPEPASRETYINIRYYEFQ